MLSKKPDRSSRRATKPGRSSCRRSSTFSRTSFSGVDSGHGARGSIRGSMKRRSTLRSSVIIMNRRSSSSDHSPEPRFELPFEYFEPQDTETSAWCIVQSVIGKQLDPEDLPGTIMCSAYFQEDELFLGPTEQTRYVVPGIQRFEHLKRLSGESGLVHMPDINRQMSVFDANINPSQGVVLRETVSGFEYPDFRLSRSIEGPRWPPAKVALSINDEDCIPPNDALGHHQVQADHATLRWRRFESEPAEKVFPARPFAEIRRSSSFLNSEQLLMLQGLSLREEDYIKEIPGCDIHALSKASAPHLPPFANRPSPSQRRKRPFSTGGRRPKDGVIWAAI